MDSKRNLKNGKMDQLNEIKYILENKDDNDLIYKKLTELNDIDITYDDLYITKIGKTINSLTKSKDSRIRDISNKLLVCWKKVVKNKSSSNEVKNNSNSNPNNIDKNKSNENKNLPLNNQKAKAPVNAGILKFFILAFTENNKKIIESLTLQNDIPLRNSARKLIYESLLCGKESKLEELTNLRKITFDLENQLFDSLYKLDEKATKYFNRVKAIVSNLKNKNNLEFKDKIIQGEISLSELVIMDVKDMASTEMQSKRKQAEDDGFKSRRSDWNSIHSSQQIGIYNCENCKSQKTSSHQMQIRGADEPMTTFITCLDCGNQWKLN